jgi:hypothetical protein
MHKLLKFSIKYRPDFESQIAAASEITTTRLFDDKMLSVGDAVTLQIAETQKVVGVGHITKIRSTTFADEFGTPEGSAENYSMYSAYYHRQIEPTTGIKDVTIVLSMRNEPRQS